MTKAAASSNTTIFMSLTPFHPPQSSPAPKPRAPLKLLASTLAKRSPKSQARFCLTSNSHFKILAGIGGHGEFESLNHEVEQSVPPVKDEVARQGLQILKKGLPGREGLPHQLVFGIYPAQHGMEQERQEVQGQ